MNPPPKTLLVIRLQAIGDVVITLPWLQDLYHRYPGIQIHFITKEECAEIPQCVSFVKEVLVLRGGRSTWRLALHALWLGMRLRGRRFDAVIDLQNNILSRWIWKAMGVRPQGVFDSASHQLAGIRTEETIHRAGFHVRARLLIETRKSLSTGFWSRAGLRPNESFMILNPASSFPSRQWPDHRFLEVGKKWVEMFPEMKIVTVGLSSMKSRTHLFADQLRAHWVDLTGKTSLTEAFLLAGLANVVITEDSGLMHMAWVQGVPVVALFGSTPAYWSAPFGPTSYCFNSSDLPCGNCFRETCMYGDNRCLTRVTAAEVMEAALEMIQRRK